MVVGKNARYNVYVQGDQSDDDIAKKTVILTVHDVGTNHNSFVDFFDHPSMADVTANALVLHICLPGQEDNAMDLTFPSVIVIINWESRQMIELQLPHSRRNWRRSECDFGQLEREIVHCIWRGCGGQVSLDGD